jgi:hypothetical protein
MKRITIVSINLQVLNSIGDDGEPYPLPLETGLLQLV